MGAKYSPNNIYHSLVALPFSGRVWDSSSLLKKTEAKEVENRFMELWCDNPTRQLTDTPISRGDYYLLSPYNTFHLQVWKIELRRNGDLKIQSGNIKSNYMSFISFHHLGQSDYWQLSSPVREQEAGWYSNKEIHLSKPTSV